MRHTITLPKKRPPATRRGPAVRKWTPAQVTAMRMAYANGVSMTKIKHAFGASKEEEVSQIVQYEIYKDLP